MELNERKIKILKAIISNYLDTAEPVGSRTISKAYNLGISPATIRNEMSDLEDLGFIVQPHTSSGRIPSDKGYRLYVDILLESQKTQMKKIALLEDLIEKADKIENLLQNIAKMLAKETHYTTMISTPYYKEVKIKNIQLISLELTKLLVIVVTDGNLIKNHIIDIKEPIQQGVLNRLSFILNEHLYGLTFEQIDLPLIKSIQKYSETHFDTITKIIDVVCQTIQHLDETDVYTSGTTNMLKFPEFSDVNKAMELIDTLEEKATLKTLLSSIMENDDDQIKIIIGEEIEIDEMKDCSIITTSYSIGGEMVGALGIIGPKRMDYLNTISSIKYLSNYLEKRFKRDDKGS